MKSITHTYGYTTVPNGEHRAQCYICGNGNHRAEYHGRQFPRGIPGSGRAECPTCHTAATTCPWDSNKMPGKYHCVRCHGDFDGPA